MANLEFTPEQLDAAKNEVSQLYMGDMLGKALGGLQSEETRDQLWTEVATTHAPFSERITALRQSFKTVSETERAYGPQLRNVGTLPFRQVEDIAAREFLGDVLFSRLIKAPGYLDYGIEMPEEARSMAQEMGMQQGWRVEPGIRTTLDQAVEATLVGRLRFQYQPKQR